VLAVIFHQLSKHNYQFYKKTLAFLIIFCSFGVGTLTQVSSYFYDERDGGQIAIERQKYGPVMRWLSENADLEAVVLGNDETSHMVVIYTPLNVFYHRGGMYLIEATRERLIDIVFTFYRLRAVGMDEVRDVFFKERGYLSANIYGMHYREAAGSYEAIPAEKIEDLVVSYKNTLAIPTKEWLYAMLKKYEVEYIIWDKETAPLWQLDRYPFLTKSKDFNQLRIYVVDK